MDELTKHVQVKMPCCVLFVVDIVLANETKGVNTKLEIWRNILEFRGFKLNKFRTEYVECEFSKNASMNDVMVELEDQVVKKKKSANILDQ